MLRKPVSYLVSLLALPLVSAAQTGPFTNGELLVRTIDTSPQALYRIDATTGNGAALSTDLVTIYNNPDAIGFDSFRGGAVMFGSLNATGPFEPRLFLFRDDGGVTELLGFETIDIQSLAPTGDGRIYFRQGGILKVLDARDEVATVLDQGGQPITIPIDHLEYDPATSALIGVIRASSTGLPCDGPGGFSVYRLPLGPGGKQLTGPPVCASVATSSTSPIGLDPLPNGNMLITFGDRNQFQDNTMYTLNPATLAAGFWASTGYSDLNGGVWCDPIGRAVVLNDTANELVSQIAGGTGAGTVLPTNVTVGGGTTGVSPTNTLADVDFKSTLCGGLVRTFGTGLAGFGGRVPILGVTNCPTIGTKLRLTVGNGRCDATGIVAFGVNSGAISVLGGTLYVPLPHFARKGVLLQGSGFCTTARGFARTSLTIPLDTNLIGFPFFAQAAISDSTAVQGWAMTNALEIRAQ